MPSTPAAPPPSASPSASLLANLRHELMRHAPFALMQAEHVEAFIAASRQAYFAPDETVLAPADGIAADLYLVRQGSVTGRKGMAELSGGFHYEAGDLFPVGAVLGQRAVTATYTANEDCFCLLLPAAEVPRLAALSAPFADFLNRRMVQFLELSQRALQAAYSSQTLAEQSLEARLETLPAREPLTCLAATPLAEALGAMHARRVGSVVVVDEGGAAQGILTRHDILGRVTLPRVPLESPVSAVMSAPIHVLETHQTLQDAALLMSRHGIRHVPVTQAGRVVNIVSERDLFALQRLSLKQLSSALRAAADVDTLKGQARDIRRFARNLVGQGVQARQLTQLVSHLNDLLTTRLVELVAARRGLALTQACWLAFGSEGRGEQTIATDQDNGLVLADDAGAPAREAWLAFAREVNEALDACGYPLCKGNVMASNPLCCLGAGEWAARFRHWIEHGAPQDLLNASIYFDLRPLAGQMALAAPLRELLLRETARTPRFIKQLADNALRHRVPLNWRGAIETESVDGREMVDLKMQGTAIFVDAARLYALAKGIDRLGTRERLAALAEPLGLPEQEVAAWIGGFEYLQMLRLQVQLPERPAPADSGGPAAASASADNPNLVELASLNEIDRRVLRETFRVARKIQQRIALDYPG